MGIDMIRKRDGREVPFDQDKIEQAIFASFQASGSARGHETSRKLTEEVVRLLENNENISAIPSVEQVQDTVEQVLMRNGFTRTAKSYILYRAERSRVREMNSRLMRTFGDIVFKDASESDIKRENANINGDTAMGAMLKYGCGGRKAVSTRCTSSIRDHGQGAHATAISTFMTWIFYTLTTTCCQIDAAEPVQGRLLHRSRLFCVSRRTSRPMRRWRASRFSRTRTISTAVSRFRTSTTAWRRA